MNLEIVKQNNKIVSINGLSTININQLTEAEYDAFLNGLKGVNYQVCQSKQGNTVIHFVDFKDGVEIDVTYEEQE